MRSGSALVEGQHPLLIFQLHRSDVPVRIDVNIEHMPSNDPRCVHERGDRLARHRLDIDQRARFYRPGQVG